MVPTGNADEASLVPDVRVVPVASLRDAAIWHGADFEPIPVDPILRQSVPTLADDGGDLADVVGSTDAVEAMIVAAAGAHHTFLLGPPGAGKTMLASRLPSLLPDLEPDAALEVTSTRSLSGLAVGGVLPTRPPLEAPHHTATAASLVGGGSGRIRPGAAARASHGVLFLDEAPEFHSAVLDALRQPLESGMISIHRANAVAHFPARFQLVLAANPCPCGQYGVGDTECACPPVSRRRYLGRLSGPLLDRIDIQLRVPRITSAHVRVGAEEPRLTSALARRRVVGARAAAAERLAGTPWRVNAHVPGPWLRGPGARLSPKVTATLDRALERGGITMRGYDRVLRVAWTLADLAGATSPDADHIGRALYLRRAVST
jgi:magnesium chelatase family protein